MGSLRPDFSGDCAIVTGGAAGIGLEIVRALAIAGAKVHAFDIETGNATDLELPAQATEPVFQRVDVTDTASVSAAVAQVVEAEGCIDLLVNNAGITRDAPLWKLSDEEWQAVLDVNLSGAFRMLRAVAAPMREARHGRIVQIASINGLRGKFGQANYSASKAGIVTLTRTAARELGGRGITVNAIAPGLIETEMTRSLPQEVLDKSLSETCLRAFGAPSDIASAVLFLLSEEASHITGTVLPVDGGQLA